MFKKLWSCIRNLFKRKETFKLYMGDTYLKKNDIIQLGNDNISYRVIKSNYGTITITKL